MLREMLAFSSCEKLAAHTHTHTQTYPYIHACIHTHVPTRTQTHASMHTDSELGELCGEAQNRCFHQEFAYNTRWTGPAAAVNLSPLQLPVFLERTVYPGAPSHP